MTPTQLPACLPVPARIERSGPGYVIPENGRIHISDTNANACALLAELGMKHASTPDHACIRFSQADAAPAKLRAFAAAPEGYALIVDPAGIRAWASTQAGRLYAAMTLRQLRAIHGPHLPGMAIMDRPALARRGVQLCFPQGHTEYCAAYMRRLVPQLARWKINELYLYLESYFDFPSLPRLAGPGAMTTDNARELDALCRQYSISLIPMLNTLGHCGELLATQRYQHLTEYKPPEDQRVVRPFNLCASRPETHRIIDSMLDDLMDCFSAPAIHVGGDEVSCIGECPVCKRGSQTATAAERYCKYYGRILKHLARRGRRGGIWGDMLLHQVKGKSKRETRNILAPWQESATIYDWQYSGGSPDSLRLFKSAGLDTIACSSTHLCYSSAMWPSQSVNQRMLFDDAIKAKADGGMSTAWGNFTGLHEEQFNYLHATGATLLWSGPDKKFLAPGLTKTAFDRAYSFHRYGINNPALTDYLHALGDAGGPVLSAIKPMHGTGLRKCLYHTTNVLDFWAYACDILAVTNFGKYRAAVANARKLWTQVCKEDSRDPDIKSLEGPLLMHEHLIARFRMSEEVYALYDRAARAQCENTGTFRMLLDKAAGRALRHLNDFAPIFAYLKRMRREYGHEQASIFRLKATQSGLRELAAVIRHFKGDNRLLPAFQQLHNVFLSPYRTRWYGDREHEWSAEPPRFKRFSLDEPKPWRYAEANIERESDA